VARLRDLTRLGAGREVEVFTWTEGRVLRLAHDPGQADSIEREARALAAARRAGAPVPAIHERVTVDGRPGVIMERVDGDDLLTRLGRRPWTVTAAGRALGRVHAQLHDVRAPDEFPRLRQETHRRVHSDLVPDDLRQAAVAALNDLPDAHQLCHGDFHPGNLLRGAHGHVAIDWTNGAAGDPAADVARTLLMLQMGEPPPDSPLLVRKLDRIGRSLLSRAYLRTYQRLRPLDLAHIRAWTPVCAVVRLTENIEQERDTLLAMARGHDGFRKPDGAPPAVR
jgi:aminoglycoside phosphotransferase (APT) family kinase protein